MHFRMGGFVPAVGAVLACGIPALGAGSGRGEFVLSEADYRDRVHAIWAGQMIATIAAFPFEHAVASVRSLRDQPLTWRREVVTVCPVDDDWYYEMSAVRAFERHGPGLTVAQLGGQWLEDECGSWGSSLEARLALERGIVPPDTGHPRFNKLWFTIGPQFSAEIYGALAPGLPDLAARLARELGRINGYAEGTDGAVFVATMVSLGFRMDDPREIVREAARVLDPASPYRQCLDLVTGMASAGRSFAEVAGAVEDRWHVEYPATNNAVANGGLVAAGLWFGGGDFWTTVELIAGAADFVDADCNAANAGAVIGAMHGMAGLPVAQVTQLGDRIAGTGMGAIKAYRKPVDERISDFARRTAAVGGAMLEREGIVLHDGVWRIPVEAVTAQPAELFPIGELVRYWNPDWTLERAGYGGAGGGMRGIRGNTHLEGDILATYPRDEVRGCLLRRTVVPGGSPRLLFEAGSEPGRAWLLEVYADNERVERRVIAGGETERAWEVIDIDLAEFAGRETVLRLYQRVLLPGRIAGNALWRGLEVRQHPRPE